MNMRLLCVLLLAIAVSARPPQPAVQLHNRQPAHRRNELVAALPDSPADPNETTLADAEVVPAKQVEGDGNGGVATPASPNPAPSILKKAAKRALGGGMGGMIAGVVQVLCLMWLRTAMNYQYRYGTSTMKALRSLYAQGGIARFYQGLGWAIIQTPLSRFGDTACNSGVLELLSAAPMPLSVRTAIAGAAAALWRVALTPIDTLKTTLQVEGPAAYAILMEKVGEHGIGTLYAGCAATWLASFVGGYPWFATFNALDSRIPHAPPNKVPLKLARSALLGVSATAVSDTIANSLRVLKTTRQTSATQISYTEAARLVVSTDGWVGLFSRGLGTRLLTNMIQASLFTVVWKLMEERLAARDTAAAEMAKASAEVPPPPVAAAAANPTPDQACDAEQEGQ